MARPSLVTALGTAVTCKDGEIEHNGKCYKLYTERKNYADARATCRGAPGGGDLVTVDSAEMQEFVKAQLGSGANLKYQGCFSDNNNARLVNSGSSKPENTPDSCIAECRNNNHQYAGVKRAGKCYTLHSSSLSWFKARAECVKNGGDLLQQQHHRPKATTPSTKEPNTRPMPTDPTAKSTTVKETIADKTTWGYNGNDTTTPNPAHGVIVAIVVAAVFVLLAFIRVMIYCCSSSDSESKQSFDVASHRPPTSFSSFNNPEFIMYDSNKSAQSQNDENSGTPGNPNQPPEGDGEQLANQPDMPYSY
ncbi:hypothetical protein NP493_390g00035 [Ridgeia piscesae]|uniref:C-type lectin domain-containing protein n=1 Tax=Ridgeia piscesae TaxID=27915 RepID=A0AAD9L217_RIDPI|nr:hypothetical protein NP493_390g00035 [Ridgeia piscesae]